MRHRRGCRRGLADTPEYAPAAIEQLAARGEALPFVRSLEAGVSNVLLRALIERFALYALRPLLDTGRLLGWPTPTGTRRAGAPGLHWAPESGAGGLQPEQQALLGVGLMLHRAPSPLRAPTFARADRGVAERGRYRARPAHVAGRLTAGRASVAHRAASSRDRRDAARATCRHRLRPRSRVELPATATGAAALASSTPTPADAAAPMQLSQEAAIEETTAAFQHPRSP